MLELIGWVGGILLAICGVPQAYQSWKEGNSKGISWVFLWLWLAGEIMVLIYIFPKYLIPLILNYGLNIIVISIIIWYKWFPRKKD